MVATTMSHSSGPPPEGDRETNNNNNNNEKKRKNEEDSSRKDWVLLSQGAEARIWKVPNHFTATTPTNPTFSSSSSSHASWMIVKERFAKTYRHPILDERLTKQRCRAEGRLLETCHQTLCTKRITTTHHQNSHSVTCWSVPAVLRIDPPLLYLEYLSDYSTVREYLDQMLLRLNETNDNTHDQKHDTQQRLLELANTMGMVMAQLHNLKMVHGDLTTSNMMISTNNDPANQPLKLVLIDFGLAKRTESAEERAVDLYVLERALVATHPRLGKPLGGSDNDKTKKDNDNDSMNEDETDPDHDDDDNNNNNNNNLEEWRIKDEEREDPKEEVEESDDFLTCLWTVYEREAHKAKATMNRLYQVRQRGRKRECFG